MKTHLKYLICLSALAIAACGVSTPADEAAIAKVNTEEPVVVPPDNGTDPVISRYASVAPDVSDNGLYAASDAVEYQFDDYLVSDGDTNAPYPVSVHGEIRYPAYRRTGGAEAKGPFPVILFLHGRHVTCNYGGLEFLSSGECPKIDGKLARVAPIDSYKGYDYIARNLATHGYVVISIDANDINDKDLAGDQGARARAQLLLHHLDIFRDVQANGGQGFDVLRGRMDFTSIGLMGHSRGGDGVTNAILFNQARLHALPAYLPAALPLIGAPADAAYTAPHNIKAVFALAPTDFDRHLATGVAFASLLPYCDGDVSNLQGGWIYDDSRYPASVDPGPKFQLLTMGTNHNYYNTIWVDDDHGSGDSFCSRDAAKTGRLSPEDQRRHGEFLISSFLRLYAGHEQRFAPYWNGQARLPEAACPNGAGTCDEKVLLSVHRATAERLLIDKTTSTNSLTQNALGGLVSVNGFAASSVCTPTGSSGVGCPSRRTYSVAPQLSLAWEAPASYESILGQVDASGFTHISLRAGVQVGDVRNAAAQDFRVVLADSAGHRASVNASRFSDALFLPPGDAANADGAKTTLNMVSLPLVAFKGIDLKSLTKLELQFDQTPKGSIQLTDIQFQNIPVH